MTARRRRSREHGREMPLARDLVAQEPLDRHTVEQLLEASLRLVAQRDHARHVDLLGDGQETQEARDFRER